MKRLSILLVCAMISIAGFSQKYNVDSAMASLKFKKDSTLKAMKKQHDSVYAAQMHGDTVSVDKEFKEKEKWEKMKGVAIYPLLKAGDESGVIPVKDIQEVPDPNMNYKLLFELTANNPDSLAKDVNQGLVEIARKMNLHIAAGIPLKKITPVIIVHAAGLFSFLNNEAYKEKYKMDNPNIKLLHELEEKGVKMIACGQAMAFLDVKKEQLLPEVRVALSAQTTLSNYQLRGFVLYRIW